MIAVYVASSERFKDVEWMTPASIVKHTSEEVSIQVIHPEDIGMKETGCTGFTNVRYAIPELLRKSGLEYGIYLDVDMLVMDNIKELWSYRQKNKWVVLEDGSDEVSIFHQSNRLPLIGDLHNHHKSEFWGHKDRANKIPLDWNCEDHVSETAKLVHYTNLDTQPWNGRHPNEEADSLYRRFKGFVC